MTSPDLIQIEARRSPHITRSIDNTALAAYMRCPREFYYAMVLHRRKKGATRPPLAFGTTWHSILETHYKTGGNQDAVIAAGIASWQPHDNPDDHRTLERAFSCYDQYLKRWGTHDEEMKGWGKTVGYPENPVVELQTELWWPGALHPYCGKIDRIIEHNGLFWVEDHKTSSQLGSSYFQQFDPSNQMMGYAWLAGKLTGLPIAGVRINALGVLKTQSKFERQTVMFSEQRLKEWADNYNVWINRLEQSALIHSEGELNVNDSYPHNFNACAGKYGMCTYVDVCASPERVRGKILENDYAHAPWDPMNPDDETTE